MENATIAIERESDVVVARQKGREIAASRGFSTTDQTLIATAISEIARNILLYALRGEIEISVLEDEQRTGILIVATDRGPGILDTKLAMTDGYSTAGSLGLGLPGTQRIMDDFALDSAVGRGTTVTMRKWNR